MTIQASLEVVRGPHLGRIVSITLNEPLTLGRADDLPLAFLDDLSMSRQHCQVRLMPNGECHITNMSNNGTLVNGREITHTKLSDGDQIAIGETTLLRVRLQPTVTTPTPAPPPASIPTLPLSRETLPSADLAVVSQAPPASKTVDITLDMLQRGSIAISRLGEVPASRTAGTQTQPLFIKCKGIAEWPFRFHGAKNLTTLRPVGGLYLVIDGAQNLSLAWQAKLAGIAPASLFIGESASHLAQVAPYFLPFPHDNEFLTAWYAARGTHSAILFDSPASPEQLFVHLRNVFIAQDESGQEYFFRYYDPRVLRVYLPTCSPRELKTFFGPIHQFIVETESADGYVAYSCNTSGLVTELLGDLELNPISTASISSSEAVLAPSH